MAGKRNEGEETHRREGLPERPASEGLEGAADEGVVRRAPVEGGEELSIGGSPPSGAGGTRNTPAPTQKDVPRE